MDHTNCLQVAIKSIQFNTPLVNEINYLSESQGAGLFVLLFLLLLVSSLVPLHVTVLGLLVVFISIVVVIAGVFCPYCAAVVLIVLVTFVVPILRRSVR
jgi:hypothetical protein